MKGIQSTAEGLAEEHEVAGDGLAVRKQTSRNAASLVTFFFSVIQARIPGPATLGILIGVSLR